MIRALLDKRRRELALIACVLLLPVPLLALAGFNLPLPGAVEREISSLLPGSEGDALESGDAAPATGGEDIGALNTNGGNVATGSEASFGPASRNSAGSSRSGGADDGSAAGPGGTEPAPGDEDLPSDGDDPRTDGGGETTPSPGAGEPGSGGSGDTMGNSASLRITADAGDPLIVASADEDRIGIEPDPDGGEGDPGLSASIAPGNGTTTEADTGDLPSTGLPIP